MDHRTLDAENVAERYVTGRLPPEEAARFEEHYLDCPACSARVEAAERLRRGLARVAETAALAPDTQAGPWERRRPAPPWALAAAALLALALLPAGWAFREVGRLRSDLGATHRALARAETGRLSAERPAALPGVEAELRKTRGDLAAAAAERDALARQLAAGRQPLVNLPILALTPLRGGLGEGPVHTLALPPAPGWVALWVEPGGEEYPAYRVVLEDAHAAAVFTAPRLTVNDLGALFVAVHSTSLHPGAYRLDVDGLPKSGPRTPIARFPLRVVASR